MTLNPADDMAVAVSGLASCGGVIVADQNFTAVCAAHCGGDLYVKDDWCAYINNSTLAPHYLIVACGPEGTVSRGPDILKGYRKKLGIPNNHQAIFLHNCGGFGVVDGILFAQRDPLLQFADAKKQKKTKKGACTLL
jgi:hypothetical protein